MRVLALSLLLGVIVWAPSSAGEGEKRADVLDRYVRSILPYKAPLTAFLKEMPKGADLHNHVDGAVYAETLIAFALAQDPPLHFDLDRAMFAPPGVIPANGFSPDEIRNDFLALGKVLDAFSVRRSSLRGVPGHDHFFNTFNLYGPVTPGYDRIATEMFTRIAAQNIRHIEIMIFVPPPSPEAYPDKETLELAEKSYPVPTHPARWSLAYPDAGERGMAFARAARELVELFETARISRLRQLNLDENAISAGYILSFDRLLDPAAFEEMLNNYIAAWNSAIPHLVAFTMVCPEDAWNSRLNFREQFKILDRYIRDDANWRDGVRPRFNWHAGELTLELNPYECLRDRIGETIWMGHANRIGHGASIAWEDNCYELLHDMRSKGICVEISPSSSETILGLAGNDHPYHLYKAAGVPVAIATDDEGVSRSNLTNEYVKAARDFGLGYHELKNLSRNSLEFSFLPGESLFVDRDYDRRKSPPPANSRKAEMQALLENDFEEFERFIADRVLAEIVVY